MRTMDDTLVKYLLLNLHSQKTIFLLADCVNHKVDLYPILKILGFAMLTLDDKIIKYPHIKLHFLKEICIICWAHITYY